MTTWVNNSVGVPPLNSFTSTQGQGSPLCVDTASARLYYLFPGNVIAPLTSGGANVLAFGADPTGSADSTAAFNTIMALGLPVYVPAGTYKVSSFATIDRDGFEIFGDGPDATIISTTSATANLFTIGAGSVLRNSAIIRDMSFVSSVTKTAGYVVALNKTYNVKLYNLRATGYFGLVDLFAAQQTVIRDCVCALHTPTTGKAISARSDGSSSNLILDNVAIDGGAGTQPYAGLYVEEWDGIFIDNSQFNRTGIGAAFNPAATKTFTHLFCENSSFDSCSANGIRFLGGVGGVIRLSLSNCWIGSHNNNGILFDVGSAVQGIRLDNCRVVNNGSYGINAQAPVAGLQMLGGLISGNGTTTTNTYSGLYIANAGTWNNLLLDGVQIGPADSFAGVQKYGIEVQAATGPVFNNSIIDNCNLSGNGTGSITFASASFTGSLIRNNQGFVTENGGTASIGAASTSVVITHGCARLPLISDIMVTPNASLGTAARFWVSGVTSTQFTINVDVAPGGAGTSFAWMARLQ